MRQPLVRLTEWTIPPDIHEFHQREDIERARMVSATLLASIALVGTGALLATLTNLLPPQLTAMLVRVSSSLVVAFVITLLVFYRTAGFTLTAHLYACTTFAIYVANLPGLPPGLLQALLVPMLAIPLFATAIGGLRVGLPWLIITAATPAALAGVWPKFLGQNAQVSVFFIGAWLVLSSSIAFVMWCFEHIAKHMRLRLDEECARFAFDAAHDPLTGLANRAMFARRLVEAIEHAGINRELLALMYIDLNDFKPINDNYGHHVGDAVLEAVGKRLTAVVRQSDTVARLGGDEFAVLYRHLRTKGDFQICVDRISQVFAQPVVFGQEVLRISAGIGVVYYPDDGRDAAALQERADALMYQSKQRRKAESKAG